MAALAVASTGLAQPILRPADEGPDAPTPRAMDASASPPPLSPREPGEDETATAADATASLVIRPTAFEVLGCTAFDASEIEALFADAVGRPLTTLDLLALVDRLRDHYWRAGFRTSEVVLPDQSLADGVVRLMVLEGAVEEIVIEGAVHVRSTWYRARLRRATRTPLDVEALTRRLEQLQAEPGVERLTATLVELGPGRHRLALRVEERPPWSLRASASNHRSPAIGSLGGGLEAGIASLTGLGDELRVAGQLSEGLRDLRVSWDAPLTPWDTRVGVAYRQGRADVVERDFEQLDIQGRFESVALELRQPVLRTRTLEIGLAASGEWRKSTSSLLGRVDCLQLGLRDCTPSAAILRLRSDATWRGARRAVALRSTVSVGVDALGATVERDAGDRDGEFVSGLLQLQWAELLPEIPAAPWLDGTQLLFRGDLQLASDPLLSIEQIAIGGARSVRGYRQNQIVRDNGAIASLELRLPVWRTGFQRSIVELAPFVDYGSGWDRRRARTPDETLVSAGLALRVAPTERVHGELSWAHRFRDDLPRGDRLQAEGIYFEVVWDVF
ncbi:MAG: ShlB/FhaC/HecB family hemolysin secretion/activation protein [Myxococcota bacterium]